MRRVLRRSADLGEDVPLGLDVVNLAAPHHLALLQLLHGEDLPGSTLPADAYLVQARVTPVTDGHARQVVITRGGFMGSAA